MNVSKKFYSATIIALGSITGAATLGQAQLNFNRTDISVGAGANPVAVAVADFNNDGKADLAVVNNSISRVKILLGDGAGGFSPAPDVQVGGSPISIAVGDFTNDGKQDLAVVNLSDATVSIRLGDGSGGFTAAQTQFVGFNLAAVAVGDFIGDGNQDFVATRYGLSSDGPSVNEVSVFRGFGDGNFFDDPPLSVNVGNSPVSVAVGDFNNDGRLDLAVANQQSDNVSILLGNAQGFNLAVNYPVGTAPNSVAVGDFNNDGQLDLAVANQFGNNVSILLGGPSGFSSASNVSVANAPSSVVVGDFNNDGRQDLALVNRGNGIDPGTVSILLGNGNGGFGTATNFAVGVSPRSVAVGDFNSDGRLDLAVTNFFDNAVSILLNITTLNPDLSIGMVDSPDPVNVGENLTYTITVTNNGPGSATNVVVTDTLPPGVTLSTATPSQGSCSGTTTVGCNLGALAPLAVSTITIVVTPTTVTSGLSNTATVTANEPDPNPANNSATSTTTVASPASPTVAVAVPRTLVSGQVNAPYFTDLGLSPFPDASAVVIAGNLPDGLQFGSPTLTGTPQQAGTFLFTVLVTDALGSTIGRMKITVCPEVITVPFICDTALLEGEPNIEYSDFITAMGGTPPYNFSLLGRGVLPPGLQLISDGTVTGTPSTSARTKKFTLQVTDDNGVTFSRPLSLTMLKPPKITARLKKAKVGASYSATLKARGGLAPIFWSGDLPAGLALDPATGVVSGVPDTAGKFTINFEASDALTGKSSKGVPLTVGP